MAPASRARLAAHVHFDHLWVAWPCQLCALDSEHPLALRTVYPLTCRDGTGAIDTDGLCHTSEAAERGLSSHALTHMLSILDFRAGANGNESHNSLGNYRGPCEEVRRELDQEI